MRNILQLRPPLLASRFALQDESRRECLRLHHSLGSGPRIEIQGLSLAFCYHITSHRGMSLLRSVDIRISHDPFLGNSPIMSLGRDQPVGKHLED